MRGNPIATALGAVTGVLLFLAIVWPGWLWGHPIWGPWGTPPTGGPVAEAPAKPAPPAPAAPAQPPAATAVPSKPSAPGSAPAPGNYAACPSPEVASGIYGPKVRAVGFPTWEYPDVDRDMADVCNLQFNANLSSGKVYDTARVPQGTIATVNTRDNLVRVYKGTGTGTNALRVEGSAVTFRMIDNPDGQPIYGSNHPFRDVCKLLANEVGFTQKEAAAGGFKSTFGVGNFTCVGIDLAPAMTGASAAPAAPAPAAPAPAAAQPPAAASAMTADQVLAQVVPNESDRKKVKCQVNPGNVTCGTSDGSKVTWRHPGGNAMVDYWGKFDAPSNASGCDVQVTSDKEKRSVVCANAGATFSADKTTWTLPQMRPSV